MSRVLVWLPEVPVRPWSSESEVGSETYGSEVLLGTSEPKDRPGSSVYKVWVEWRLGWVCLGPKSVWGRLGLGSRRGRICPGLDEGDFG